MGFVDRFRRLEIPEDKRRFDWSFLDSAIELPGPLPLAEEPLFATMAGRVWVPRDRAAAPGEASLLFHREPHALEEGPTLAAAEAAWRTAKQAELAREERRFLSAVPTDVVRDAHLVSDARDILRVGLEADASLARLVGDARLLRLHGKLYDLKTLREYVAIFERAIAPDCYRALQALPETVAPEEMLARIEARLGDIHAKARSPLRNKMSTARAVVAGVTYLPIYREEAAALFAAFARVAERRMKLASLAREA